jgi:hypothetical protein
MNMPGFAVEASLYGTRVCYQAEATPLFSSENRGARVYMQKPRSENTEGGLCSATTRGGTIYAGKYDAAGDCCGPKLSNGSQSWINCDNTRNTCTDRKSSRLLGLRLNWPPFTSMRF